MEYLGKKANAIGFAVYLNEINRIMSSRKEYDVDAVIIYGSENIADIAKAVKSLQEQGLTVRAEKQLPEGLRYRDLYQLENGQLRKEGESC